MPLHPCTTTYPADSTASMTSWQGRAISELPLACSSRQQKSHQVDVVRNVIVLGLSPLGQDTLPRLFIVQTCLERGGQVGDRAGQHVRFIQVASRLRHGVAGVRGK